LRLLKILYLLFGTLVFLFSGFTFAQTAQDGFGKNRIQYKEFTWKYLSSNSIDMYYYEGGDKLAATAIEVAEVEFKKISDLFGFTPFSKIKVFLFLSSNDRLMSNVGLGENGNITGGKTNFTKSSVEAAYEGSISNLRKQISAGIAQILIRDMLFGGSIKDAIQNSFLLTLPDWFVGGAIRYASEGWSSEMDDYIKEIGDAKRIRQPANYVGQDAFLIGHSIWNYIAERYGRSSIGNILNLTRIIRNDENAIVGTLGMPFPTFIRDWKAFYQNQHQLDNSFFNEPPKNQKFGNNFLKKNYSQICLSPDGELAAYTQHWKGKFQVVVLQLANMKSHVIFRGGSKAKHQNSDGEFPVVCFSPENQIWVAYPSKGKWKGITMTSKGKIVRRIEAFEQFHDVYNMSISQNSKKMVISGSIDGFSDIFVLSLKNLKIKRLTSDFYDDLNPVFSSTGDSILFSSNRPRTDTLKTEKSFPDPKRKYAIFSISESEGALAKLFYTNEGNLIKPWVSGEGEIFCLSDESGVMNMAQIFKKEGNLFGQILTSNKYSIRDFAYMPKSQHLVYTTPIRLKSGLYIEKSFDPSPLSLPQRLKLSNFEDTISKKIRKNNVWLSDSGRIDIRNYVFEDEKSDPNVIKPTRKKMERVKLKKDPKPFQLEITGPFDYSPRVTANYLTTGLVVSPIPSWGLGALVDFSMHDIFENHRVNGGMTYFFTDMEMRNNNAFLEYNYLKKRLDFKLRAERVSIQNTSFTQQIRQRDILYGFSGAVAYPFSNALRVELSPYFQTTQRVVFNNNPTTPLLGGPDQNVYYWGAKAEMVFDNTTSTGLNMISGTRFKVRAQYQFANQYSRKEFGEIFMDFRTYQPIHKEITFAFRASYGQFFGPAAKKFMLGGMDNWLFRSYEVSKEKDDPLRGLNQNNQIISSDEAQTDWLFNRYATNMRGFRYNDIYGSSFLVFNAELRIPIIRYFYKGPINSNFWRNLQLTTFTDVGSAWTGVGPFNANNSLNTKQVNEGNFSIKVKSYENPFLVGYGLGARTMVLGYYLKFDMAWGQRNGFTSEPKYYFTFGYDF
jgi:hypothetical protein